MHGQPAELLPDSGEPAAPADRPLRAGRGARRALWGIVAALAAVVGGAYFVVPMLLEGTRNSAPATSPAAIAPAVMAAPIHREALPPPDPVVDLGLAYGTEKEGWLKWAVEAFAQTPAGATVHVNLIPFGTVEAAHAIVQGDTRIHAWAPASTVYEASFVQQWQVKHGSDKSPLAKQQVLALTPMVFVMWEKRYAAFQARYKELNFRTLAQALDVEGGWGAIADKPEWGLFKFGHTHPNQSNSGLATLLLMAYDFQNKIKNLSPADVVAPKFQSFMEHIERGVSGLSSSTGYLMKEMVLKGPSSFDVLMLYESVAIERLQNAQGRWDELRIIYPRFNLWNDNPYYILATPWCTPRHQQAAELFLKFLLSETAQRKALEHGFRPGEESVPIRFAESPFVKYAQYGLSVDLPAMCENPSPEVIDNLQQAWLRAMGTR